MSKQIDQGFPPVIGECPRVLVLGTMPSVKSLQENQYYGHPRNAFWWIMSHLCGFDSDTPYKKRLALAMQSGVALWDVVHTCHRPGSLDADIDQASLQANDIATLLAQYPSIKAIGFNGQAAAKLFAKHNALVDWQGEQYILPSTSPANAAKNKEVKLQEWQVLKPYLQQ